MDDPLEGCRWRALPHDFPPWDTVYDHWRRWQKRGVWPEAVAVLGIRWGEGALGRGRRALRHAILDRQSVQDRRRGRGTWPARKARGSKAARATGPSTARTRCWPCTVCAANKADGAEAGAVMVQACERHPSIEGFTADTADKRHAEHVACEMLGVELKKSSASPGSSKPSRRRLQKGGGCKPIAFRRLSRTHLRVAWPVPSALQRVRKSGRQRRGVALVRDDALAPAPTRLIISTAF